MAIYSRSTLALVAGLACACSNFTGSKTSSNRGGDSADAVQAPATTPVAAVATSLQTGDTLTKSGLLDACQYKAGDQQSGCFTCMPRELPITKCADVPAGFDPVKSCTHDMTVLTCDLGTQQPFVIDTSKPTSVEQVYEDLPLLVLAAKALLATKLPHDPKLLDLISGTLDALTTNKQALFAGGDVGPFLDTVQALVKKDEPSVSDAKIAETRAAATAAIAGVRAGIASGTLSDGDFLAFGDKLLGAFPADLVGPLLGQMDLSKVLSSLQTSGGNDSLSQLLAAAGGGPSSGQILTVLQNAQGAATASAAGVQTATATATGH